MKLSLVHHGYGEDNSISSAGLHLSPSEWAIDNMPKGGRRTNTITEVTVTRMGNDALDKAIIVVLHFLFRSAPFAGLRGNLSS